MKDVIHTQWLAFRLFLGIFKDLQKGPIRLQDILHQCAQMAIGSLPLVVISTAFAGLVVTTQMAHHMDLALSNTSMIPGFSGQFILRELGTAIPAMLMVAKVGASIAAEVSTMKITDQIDALKLLRIDPVRYLLIPRFFASIFALSSLTLIAIFVTLLFSGAVAVISYGYNPTEYLNHFKQFVSFTDFLCAFTKSVVFGAVIPCIACAYGLRCRGGAEGVGLSTTNAVVGATVTVVFWDFLITAFFSTLYH